MSEPMLEVDARAAAAAAGHTGRASSLREGGQPPPATISVSVVLLAVLAASVAALLMLLVPCAGDGVGKGVIGSGMQGAGGSGATEEDAGKRAEPVEHAVADPYIPGFNSRLDAFRAWARLAWMKLRRARSNEPRYLYADDAGGGVGNEAKKSFETGKATVEQTAAKAARTTGDAVEAPKEKVKGAASPSSDDSEL